MSDSPFVSLRIVRDGPVAEVVLVGPGRGNAMGPDFWRELPLAFAALHDDESVRAIILRGEGKHFCTGLDLAAMMGELGSLIAGENLAKERRVLLDLIRRYQDAITSVEACRKPVIAAIHGWCIGGAIDLISACDVRVSSTDAQFSVREVRIGIVADVGTLQRLPRIVGQGWTRQLALTGEDFDAQKAARIGLVTELFAPDVLLDGARRMARTIAANPPLVAQGVKQVLNECDGLSVAEGLRHVSLWNAAFLQSMDFAEAFSAFIEKRTPEFSGR